MRILAYAFFTLLVGCTSAVGAVAHVETAVGDIAIRTVGPKHMLVMVDTERLGEDGLIDQWFVLEAADAHDLPLLVELRNARLLYSPGNLRVIAPDQQTIYEFVVPDYEDVDHPAPPAFRVVRSSGIGLSHVVHETQYPISAAMRVMIPLAAGQCEDGGDCLPVLEWWWDSSSGGGASTCDRGGVGANSCSVTASSSSCSVTCNAGYYACCKAVAGLPSCKCVRG